LLATEEFLDREADVASDLPQEGWGDISTCVERNCRAATVAMPVLFVGTALPNFDESKPLKEHHDLPRLQDRDRAHSYAT